MIDEANIIFNFDKSYHISHNQDYFCCVGTNVIIYDVATGEVVSKLKGIKQPSCSQFTSNRKLIIKTTTGNYYIYDLELMDLVKKISAPPGVKSSTTAFQVTSDSKYIIDFSYIFPTYKLMIVEIETGTCKFFDLGYARQGFVFSTEIESKYYLMAGCAETVDASDVSIEDFYELFYRAGNFSLQKIFVHKHNKLSVADYNSNKFAIADHSNRIKLLDIQNNDLDKFEYMKNGVLYDLKFSPDGQLVALIESKNVYIYNLPKKECIKSYKIEYGCYVDFFDHTKLLVGTWEKGYCISLI